MSDRSHPESEDRDREPAGDRAIDRDRSEPEAVADERPDDSGPEADRDADHVPAASPRLSTETPGEWNAAILLDGADDRSSPGTAPEHDSQHAQAVRPAALGTADSAGLEHGHGHGHEHGQGHGHAHAATPVRPNAWAVIGTLWLVVIAVLFGIFGPQIGARGHAFGGVPAGELVDAAAERHSEIVSGRGVATRTDRPIELRGGDDPRSIDGEISALFGTPFATPDLSAIGLSLERVVEVTLPGADAHAVHLVFRGDESSLSVFALPDRGQFVSRNAFGQPSTLSPGRVFRRSEVIVDSTGGSALYSDGAVVWLVIGLDPDLVDAALEQTLASGEGWLGDGDA